MWNTEEKWIAQGHTCRVKTQSNILPQVEMSYIIILFAKLENRL